MRLLLDTHAVAWWLPEAPQLSGAAYEAVASASEVWVSAVSAFEMATKHRLGKWPGIDILTLNFESRVESESFRLLSVTPLHAVRAGHMAGETAILSIGPWQHKRSSKTSC